MVGSAFNATGTDHAFLYSGGHMVDLTSLLPSGSGWTLQDAYGINDLGQIVGDGVVNGQEEAFLMTPVPLLSTAWLFGIGLILVVGASHRRGGRSLRAMARAV
ncbi:MAG: hypothetical protein ACYCRH_10250 [Acidiferrobacteraceae bacterium]